MSHRKKRHFLVEAWSSGDLRGKQRVHEAAQLIGLMTDDSLMAAACHLCFSLSLCVLWLYVTVAAPDDVGKRTGFAFWANWHTVLFCVCSRVCHVCCDSKISLDVWHNRRVTSFFFLLMGQNEDHRLLLILKLNHLISAGLVSSLTKYYLISNTSRYLSIFSSVNSTITITNTSMY